MEYNSTQIKFQRKSMKKSLLLVSLVGMGVLFSGCATLVNKDTQAIYLNGVNNEKVIIGHTEDNSTINDPQLVTLPAMVVVKRENKNLLIKSKNGKCKKIVPKKISGWFFANIWALPGGTLLSSTTDYSTGAMWKYDDIVNVSCPQK